MHDCFAVDIDDMPHTCSPQQSFGSQGVPPLETQLTMVQTPASNYHTPLSAVLQLKRAHTITGSFAHGKINGPSTIGKGNALPVIKWPKNNGEPRREAKVPFPPLKTKRCKHKVAKESHSLENASHTSSPFHVKKNKLTHFDVSDSEDDMLNSTHEISFRSSQSRTSKGTSRTPVSISDITNVINRDIDTSAEVLNGGNTSSKNTYHGVDQDLDNMRHTDRYLDIQPHFKPVTTVIPRKVKKKKAKNKQCTKKRNKAIKETTEKRRFYKSRHTNRRKKPSSKVASDDSLNSQAFRKTDNFKAKSCGNIPFLFQVPKADPNNVENSNVARFDDKTVSCKQYQRNDVSGFSPQGNNDSERSYKIIKHRKPLTRTNSDIVFPSRKISTPSRYFATNTEGIKNFMENESAVISLKFNSTNVKVAERTNVGVDRISEEEGEDLSNSENPDLDGSDTDSESDSESVAESMYVKYGDTSSGNCDPDRMVISKYQ